MTNPSALWHTSAQKSLIRTQPSLPLTDGQCRIEAVYSLISSGTETLVASGQVPLELHRSMRVPYMEGDFSFPVKYGYSLVGKVIEGNKSILDKHVHLLHPHQSECVVNETDVTVIPNEVPPQRAVLASNLETALNAIWDSGLSTGDRILVVGMGLVGSLVAHLARQFPATQVRVAEADSVRQTLAKNLGFQLHDSSDVPFDVAFHTSGSSAGLQTGIDGVGNGGKIVELSWYGTRSAKVKLGGSFHQQRKQIISSQVSQIPPHQQARWDYRRRKQTVLELLKNDRWDEFLTATVNFADSPQLFDKLRQGDRSQLSWTIRY
ncbi:MAG: zinc-binding alcohol dehydrogenase [Tunicatimonas sp.]|uniref:zinc-dependent alcohol dehydrogenase n=1 Tax=Tunicatimonas sp. TaxID=1940096 RepID=UPI003C76EEF4